MGSGYLGATLNVNLGSYAHSGQRTTVREGSYFLNKISVTRPQETIITGGQERERRPHQGDAASVRSVSRVSDDGSQEFIIRRTVEYKINYADGERSS